VSASYCSSTEAGPLVPERHDKSFDIC